MIRAITKTEKQTIAIAQRVAKHLKKSDVILFTGGLGVGKTAFCKGIAKGLECIDEVSSPTFAIVNVYRGKQVFAHFDMYRISTQDDLFTCGFYDYLDGGAVLAVEWSENVREFLTDIPVIEIEIKQIDEETREILITGLEIDESEINE